MLQAVVVLVLGVRPYLLLKARSTAKARYPRRTIDKTNALIGNVSFNEYTGLILCFIRLFTVLGFKSQSTNIDLLHARWKTII